MKTIIIDDEMKAAKLLEIELTRLELPLEIIGNYQDPDKAITAIDRDCPDLILLDVDMPRKSGFDVLNACQYSGMQVIFVTAYSDYALQAIKANALDYILKPIDPGELQTAIEKAIKQQAENQVGQFQFLLEKLGKMDEDFIKIPSNDQVLFFRPEEIIYCQAESNYTQVVTTAQKILISKTLKHMEQILPAHIFIRIHQSYIVNKNHIRAYSRLDGGYVTLSNGETARIAKNKKKLVL